MGRIRDFIGSLDDTNYITRITRVANYLWAAAKIIYGFIFASYLFCISGMYSAAVGVAKEIYLKGKLLGEDDFKKRSNYYLAITIMISVASLCFTAYMVRLFFVSQQNNYGLIPSIAFAAISFAELFIAVAGITRANKKKDLLLGGLKCVNLTCALTSLVFTQNMLLGVVMADTDTSIYNAIGGVAFGSVCFLISVFMLVNYLVKRKKYNLNNNGNT